MSTPDRPRLWARLALPIALALAGLGALYAGPLWTGFLNDDYLFLEQARREPLWRSLGELGALHNYYRPVSRQLYFEALTGLAGGEPLAFRAVHAALFVAALLLLADLLRVFLPRMGVAVGLLTFALLPLQRVNLTWISCSQDLLALMFTLAALAGFRRGRDGWAAACFALAVFSKETALALPVALAAWLRWVEPATGARRWTRLLPFAAVIVAWLGVTVALRLRHAGALPFLHFTPDHFVAGLVHGLQSLLGLETPIGLASSLKHHGPDLLALACLGALGLWLDRPAARPAAGAGAAATPRLAAGAMPFALVWIAAFALITGPAAATWSGYYYTLAAAGLALLVGRIWRGGWFAWIALVAGLLWWHAGVSGTRVFAIRDHPWVWTSHLTAFYFERAATLTGRMRAQLATLEPDPPAAARFFFARLPSFAGFQMGNGALIRALYDDPSLESHFFSQFSESLAAGKPCRFYTWNGNAIAPLYDARARDPWFQVGSDLLLLDRPGGAAHAFSRGLAAGETRDDHLYWLGWAELWRGRRARAEAAWSTLGARDDTTRYAEHLAAAHRALFVERDTVRARRELAAATLAGIGLPDPHAVLGELLYAQHPKYGLLELKVAAMLDRDDWLVRRSLVLGLAEQGMSEAARSELEVLLRQHPQLERDTLITSLKSAFETMDGRSGSVARF